MKTIKLELKLPTLPHRMECFDNSNIQGTNPVASCVVFIDGKPAKKEYRKFHVKTVVGADDFASMEEIIFRRYKRVLDEGLELPDLIVIDGGKGQLHSAVNSLKKLDLYGKVPILGLAKKWKKFIFLKIRILICWLKIRWLKNVDAYPGRSPSIWYYISS